MRPFPTPDAKPPLRTRPALPLVRPFLVDGRRSAPRLHRDPARASGRAAPTCARRPRAYGSAMRFNHMELTFARGTLTKDFREEIYAFYGSVLGWSATDTEVVGQQCHILLPDADQFILLAESDKPMDSPGFDHLGLLQDTREEVDDLLDRKSVV